MSPRTPKRSPSISDVQGISRLIIDAVTGVSTIVEDVHRTITRKPPLIGESAPGRARGISGWVYRSVRGVTRAIGLGHETALEKLTPLLSRRGGVSNRQRAVAVEVLNGVMGDYLEATGNPMATAMHVQYRDQALVLEDEALTLAVTAPGNRLVMLVHGLCMGGPSWHRDGHDHGASLCRDLGYTPLYLAYNSGRHISENGREFADILERLVDAWPVRVEELVLLGHSMGGLVSRSACHYASQAGHRWLDSLGTCVFLGTPHLGAPLERAGNWADMLLGISPYTAPLARVGKIRSAGVQDLRYGSVLDEDWGGREGSPSHDPRAHVPLPDGVPCWMIAASRNPDAADVEAGLPGDGLVPVQSALGQHPDPALSFPIPASHKKICCGLNHLDLLSRSQVYDHIRRGLEQGKAP